MKKNYYKWMFWVLVVFVIIGIGIEIYAMHLLSGPSIMNYPQQELSL